MRWLWITLLGWSSPGLAQDLGYTVATPDPSSHQFWVTFQARGLPERPLVWTMPVWTPGSYQLRDYRQNLHDLEALTGQIQPLGPNRWTVTPTANGTLTLRYQIYANALSVHGSHLNPDHAYFNGASLFPYLERYQDRPITLTLQNPIRAGTKSPPPCLRSARGNSKP